MHRYESEGEEDYGSEEDEEEDEDDAEEAESEVPKPVTRKSTTSVT